MTNSFSVDGAQLFPSSVCAPHHNRFYLRMVARLLLVAAVVSAFSVLLAPLVQGQDGFDLGQWSVETYDKGTRSVPLTEFAPFHIRVHVPIACSAQCGEFQSQGFPVVLFMTGYTGQIDAFKYDVILSGIARHGIIVVAVDQKLGFTLTVDHSVLGEKLNKVLGYIKSTQTGGLLSDMRDRGFTNTIYLGGSRVIMAGHTSSVHTVLRNIENSGKSNGTCSQAGGVIMLSPLDGQDPLGFGGKFIITPGTQLPMAMPGLLISAERDSAFGTIKGIACVPDNRGNELFFEAWQGSIQLIDALRVGTLDVIDEADSVSRYEKFCAQTNSTEPEVDRLRYRVMVRGAIVSFIKGVVLGSTSDIGKLSNPRDLNYDSVHKEKGQGYSFTCAWSPPPVAMSKEQEIGFILFGVCFVLTVLAGLYCFFHKVDEDVLNRYHPTDGNGYDPTPSFRTKLDPQYEDPPARNETGQIESIRV